MFRLQTFRIVLDRNTSNRDDNVSAEKTCTFDVSVARTRAFIGKFAAKKKHVISDKHWPWEDYFEGIRQEGPHFWGSLSDPFKGCW